MNNLFFQNDDEAIKNFESSLDVIEKEYLKIYNALYFSEHGCETSCGLVYEILPYRRYQNLLLNYISDMEKQAKRQNKL